VAGIADLIGRTFGPLTVEVSADRVSQFADVTGDDAALWAEHAPPLFANVALFAVAPAFLEDPAVVPFTTSLIHSEQSFQWHRGLGVGERLRVVGAVDGVRARSGLNLVTFHVEAASDSGPWLDGSSVFLMADEAAGELPEVPEPAVGERPATDSPAPSSPLPSEGEPIAPLHGGASRLDLVRYAAATRDWNPIHWDHASARAAGLPGTIVHGLLMAAWMGRAAARYSPNAHSLTAMNLRFRKPLRPGERATVTGTVGAMAADGVDVDLVLESGGDRLVTGRARVTR
jgi:acyl dehydratase